MAGKKTKVNRSRMAGAYVSSLISIALVLVLVGVAALLSVNAGVVSDYFKESLQMSVLLKQGVNEETAAKFEKELSGLPYIHSSRIVSREEGTQELKSMLGEDFLSVFESSPVPVSLDLTLESEYVHPDSLRMVIGKISENSIVDEVSCQQSLVEALNSNIARISVVLSVFIILLLFISYVLIGNVIRITVFSNRFVIHTMKLVGATKAFIRAPYLKSSVIQGLVASVIALIIIAACLAAVGSNFPQLFEVFGTGALVKTGAIVVVSGVLICLASTYFTVGKLVSMNKDDLYS